MNKNKKYLYEVEFLYVKEGEPQELRFKESFYETAKSLETIINIIERIMFRTGHRIFWITVNQS